MSDQEYDNDYDDDNANLEDYYYNDDDEDRKANDTDDDEDEPKQKQLEDEDDEEEDEHEYSVLDLNTNQKGEKTKIVYIDSNNRKTSKFMTNFEYARLIGARAVQIENNEPINPIVKEKFPNLTNSLDLAEKELNEKSIDFPIRIERPIVTRNGIKYVELWTVKEMILPSEQITYSF